MSTSQGVNVSTSDLTTIFQDTCIAIPSQPYTDVLQVLRYSALFFGIFYGFSHQRTVTANTKAAHIEHEYKQKESLIHKAKEEWAKKNLPAQAKTADDGGMSSFQKPEACVTAASNSCDPFIRFTTGYTDTLSPSYHQPGRQELRPRSISELPVEGEFMSGKPEENIMGGYQLRAPLIEGV